MSTSLHPGVAPRSQRFHIRETEARSILSPTSGFIAQAGFSHSLTPARNCTFGCVYCYVPTMRFQGGLQPEDWRRWGQFTTFKSNAAELLARKLRGDEVIYCSPLVDPYQPAEESQGLMPDILAALIRRPPRVLVVQTRGSLIVRDLPLLAELGRVCRVRVSFSVTTDCEDVRRLYEAHCSPIAERLDVLRQLRDAGVAVSAALSPLLPCNPERLAESVLDVTDGDVIADALHVRAVKRFGATTREEAMRIAEVQGHQEWFDPGFQERVLVRVRAVVEGAGRRFGVGVAGFGLLAG